MGVAFIGEPCLPASDARTCSASARPSAHDNDSGVNEHDTNSPEEQPNSKILYARTTIITSSASITNIPASVSAATTTTSDTNIGADIYALAKNITATSIILIILWAYGWARARRVEFLVFYD